MSLFSFGFFLTIQFFPLIYSLSNLPFQYFFELYQCFKFWQGTKRTDILNMILYVNETGAYSFLGNETHGNDCAQISIAILRFYRRNAFYVQ